MAISANSYGSVTEVEAMTRHLLDGAMRYSQNTQPKRTDVEKFIDRASALLNTALASYGFTIPVTQADAKLALDSWTVAHATAWVELTQRASGFNTDPKNRAPGFLDLHEDAAKFVAMNAHGWKQLGAAVTNAASNGLTFTALDEHDERTDPDVTGREQPLFRRRLFEAP